jgi:hypothetical protein
LTHCWTPLNGDLQLSESVKLWTLNLRNLPVCHTKAAAEVGDRTKKPRSMGTGFWRVGIFQPVPVTHTGYTIREIP